MSAAVALGLLGVVLGAPGELRIDTGISLDGRARSFSPRGGPVDRTGEAVAVPHATLRLTEPDLRVTATYAPRLRAPDLLDRADVVVLHTAEVGVAVRPGGAWQLSGNVHGELGTTDLITESRQAGALLQTITTTSRLRYQAARALLDAQGRLDPRFTLSLTAGAFVEGGEGSAAELILPIQRGVQGGAGLAWTASRLDRLTLRASAVNAWLDRGPTAGVLTVDATWRRRLHREWDAWAGAGAAGGYAELPGGSTRRRVYPAAELGFAHTPVAVSLTPPSEHERLAPRPMPVYRISTEAALRLSPVVDRATGEVDPQLEGTLSASWPVTPRWGLGVRGGAATLSQDAGTTRRGRVEAGVAWAVAMRVKLGAGAYASWQRASTPALPSFTESGVFLSIGFEAPPIAF